MGPSLFPPFLFWFHKASIKPTTGEAAVAAYWGRAVFNRTLRCDEAGCALALLDWPSPELGAVADLEALPTCKLVTSWPISDSSAHLNWVPRMHVDGCS